jgi:hypothetical protein
MKRKTEQQALKMLSPMLSSSHSRSTESSPLRKLELPRKKSMKLRKEVK